MKIIVILSSLVTLSCFLFLRQYREKALESFSLGEFLQNEFKEPNEPEPKVFVDYVKDFFDKDGVAEGDGSDDDDGGGE